MLKIKKQNILINNAGAGFLICTLFTGQTSKEGIFMRYSYEFKLLCVDLYKSGIYPDTPNGTTDERFKKNVREWARMVDSNGPEVLKHKVFMVLLRKILKTNSLWNDSLLVKYSEFGYNDACISSGADC